MRLSKWNAKYIIKLFSLVLLIFFCYVVYLGISIYQYGQKNDTVNADAAIVLGAAVWGDKPSPVFEERIKHGIWLYRKGYVQKLIFTGGIGPKKRFAESVVAKKYAQSKSVSSNDIIIETKSRTTEENLEYAKEIAKKNGLSSFIIVSDPLHMKRAMRIGTDYQMKVYSWPTPTTRYTRWGSQLQFLFREIYFYSRYMFYRLLH